MYWPLGTPRIYATSSTRQPISRQLVSYDGLTPPAGGPNHPLLSPTSAIPPDEPTSLVPPLTPATPLTPGIKPVEYSYPEDASLEPSSGPVPPSFALNDPILALRVARAGQIFAVITATSITVWQTKVREPGPCRVQLLPDFSASPLLFSPSSFAPKPPSNHTATTSTCCYGQMQPSLSCIRAWVI
jgi:hypothetical protein